MDFINAAMYMNEARAKEVDFIPYLRIGTEVVVAKENVKKITGRDDSLRQAGGSHARRHPGDVCARR